MRRRWACASSSCGEAAPCRVPSGNCEEPFASRTPSDQGPWCQIGLRESTSAKQGPISLVAWGSCSSQFDHDGSAGPECWEK